MELDNGKLEVHLVVFEDLEPVEISECLEYSLYVLSYYLSASISTIDFKTRFSENFPECHDASTEGFNADIEFLIELIHLDEVFTVEVSFLYIGRIMRVSLVDLGYLPEQVLLVNCVAALVELRKLALHKACLLYTSPSPRD